MYFADVNRKPFNLAVSTKENEKCPESYGFVILFQSRLCYNRGITLAQESQWKVKHPNANSPSLKRRK